MQKFVNQAPFKVQILYTGIIIIIFKKKNYFQAPLHVAAKHGRVENIKLLVEWKADLLAKDKHGFTALDIADQVGHEECMKVLKQAAGKKKLSFVFTAVFYCIAGNHWRQLTTSCSSGFHLSSSP